MRTDPTKYKPTPAELDAEAARNDTRLSALRDLDVEDSALSEWGAGKVQSLLKLQKRLAHAGWQAWFVVGLRALPSCVYGAPGEYAPARLINGRFGPAWALLTPAGRYSGKFVSNKSGPLLKARLEYVWEQRPAHARLEGTRFSLWPAIAPDVGADEPRAAPPRIDLNTPEEG